MRQTGKEGNLSPLPRRLAILRRSITSLKLRMFPVSLWLNGSAYYIASGTEKTRQLYDHGEIKALTQCLFLVHDAP